MSTPAIIVVVILAAELGAHVAKDGEPHTVRTFSAWRTLLGNGILALLLYWGGFFA